MSKTTQKPLRYVVVGAGAGIYASHKLALQHVGGEVVGLSDINRDAIEAEAAEWGCPTYTDHKQMIAETKPDVVVIITPHRFHVPVAMDAFEAGCHVLTEKPIAVHIQEADMMIAAAQKAGKLLAVSFQQRLRPEIITANEMIQSGKLGRIQNVDIKMTWTRPALYFKSSDWRGTWKGEGGGVLLNQAPHEMDLMCHLVGMPVRVVAWVRTTIHDIETEDTIQAMVEWENGAMGTLHISTAEAGQPQRFQIIGTRGHLDIASGTLQFKTFEMDLLEFIATSDRLYSGPEVTTAEVEIPAGEGKHTAIYANLEEAIRSGAPLAASGESAAQSLELANAMLYSSYINAPVEFPLDRQKYVDLLEDFKAGRASLR